MSMDVPRAACLKLLGYIKNGNRVGDEITKEGV